MLRRHGYDHVLSIEHEDALMSVEEGLERAAGFLAEAMICEPAAKPWWC
jgi:sugar phosphate isomerase/epimerase